MTRIVDSRFLSRVSNVQTLLGVLGLGATVLVAVALVSAEVIGIAEWIPVACFAVWTVAAALLAGAWTFRRQGTSLVSPFDARRLDRGSDSAMLTALAEAEERGRAFIAEAAVLMPPLDGQQLTDAFVSRYVAYADEVASVLRRFPDLDERWLKLWQIRPTWVDDHLFEPPYTRGRLDTIVRYAALRARHLRALIEWLDGGRGPLPSVARSIERWEGDRAS